MEKLTFNGLNTMTKLYENFKTNYNSACMGSEFMTMLYAIFTEMQDQSSLEVHSDMSCSVIGAQGKASATVFDFITSRAKDIKYYADSFSYNFTITPATGIAIPIIITANISSTDEYVYEVTVGTSPEAPFIIMNSVLVIDNIHQAIMQFLPNNMTRLTASTKVPCFDTGSLPSYDDVKDLVIDYLKNWAGNLRNNEVIMDLYSKTAEFVLKGKADAANLKTYVDTKYVSLRGSCIEVYQNCMDAINGGWRTVLALFNHAYDKLRRIKYNQISGWDFSDDVLITGNFDCGVLLSIFGDLLTVIGAIASSAQQIWGYIFMGIGMLTKFVGKLANDDFVGDTTFNYSDSSANLNFANPVLQLHLDYSNSIGIPADLIDSYIKQVKSLGACKILSPGMESFIWFDGRQSGDNIIVDYINFEMYPSFKGYIDPAFIKDNFVVNTTTTDPVIGVPSLDALCEAYVEDGFDNYEEANMNDYAFRFFSAMLIYLVSLSNQPDSMIYYTTTNLDSDEKTINFLIWRIATWLIKHSSTISVPDIQWDNLVSLITTHWDAFLLKPSSDSTSSPFLLSTNSLNNLRCYEYITRYVTEVTWTGNDALHDAYVGNLLYKGASVGYSYPISEREPDKFFPPQFTRKAKIAGYILTGVVIAATAITTVVVSTSIKRFSRSYSAKAGANVEQTWETYKKNPTADNYKTYQAAVRSNNRLATLTGGTKFSYNGMWADTSSGLPVDEEKFSEVVNKISGKDSGDLEKPLTIADVLLLINGSFQPQE